MVVRLKWDDISRSLKPAKGREVEEHEPLTDKPGIYILYTRKKGRRIPYYIGRSDTSVYVRIGKHFGESGKNDNKPLYDFINTQDELHYLFSEIKNETHRCCFERSLYDQLIENEFELYNRERPGCPDGTDCGDTVVQSPF